MSTMVIPLQVVSNIPGEALTITELLKLQLPAQSSSSIISTKPKAWFSNNSPDLCGSNMAAFLAWPIPAAEQIKRLFEVISEEWHMGR